MLATRADAISFFILEPFINFGKHHAFSWITWRDTPGESKSFIIILRMKLHRKENLFILGFQKHAYEVSTIFFLHAIIYSQ